MSEGDVKKIWTGLSFFFSRHRNKVPPLIFRPGFYNQYTTEPAHELQQCRWRALRKLVDGIVFRCGRSRSIIRRPRVRYSATSKADSTAAAAAAAANGLWSFRALR